MYSDRGTVKTPGLNVHDSPGGEVIDVLAMGDRVEVMERVKPGKLWWCYVRSPKIKGGYVVVSGIQTDELAVPGPSQIQPPPDIEPPPHIEEPVSTSTRWFIAAILIVGGVVAALWLLPS